MADGKECWDCFFCGKSYGRNYKGEFEYECKRTHRTTKGDSTCSYFIADTSDVKSCSDCDYFGYHNCGSILEKANYCEKKKKVVDPDALACPYFCE